MERRELAFCVGDLGFGISEFPADDSAAMWAVLCGAGAGIYSRAYNTGHKNYEYCLIYRLFIESHVPLIMRICIAAWLSCMAIIQVRTNWGWTLQSAVSAPPAGKGLPSTFTELFAGRGRAELGWAAKVLQCRSKSAIRRTIRARKI